MDHNHLTIKTFMAITAERDAAIRERNMALEERKRAFAERDMAMLQRDAAMAECNAAIQERDRAISSLRFQDNDNTSPPSGEVKRIQYHHPHNQQTHSDVYISITETSETPTPPSKPKRSRVTKGNKSNSPRTGKRTAEQSNSVSVACDNFESDEDELDKQVVSWKDNLGLNQINFDDSAMPVPVCTCTGSPQPCYRWGSGGWQSACCTTTISMYPLPQVANKRYSRVGGRKMSGSAFSKLLNRLAAEGYDFSAPLDLKEHWAKHGTNRYSTLK